MKVLKPGLEILKIVLAVFLSVIIIRSFIAQPFIVEGSSMEPNFHNGEYLVVEKVGYRLHEPNRGDVVVLKYPNNPAINYIKRLIGLPGDTIKINDGKVFVNGTALKESYLAAGEETTVSRNPEVPYEVTLGADEYFVMGDNRNHSSDSRDGWILPKKLIVGRSAVVLYSNDSLKAVASPNY